MVGMIGKKYFNGPDENFYKQFEALLASPDLFAPVRVNRADGKPVSVTFLPRRVPAALSIPPRPVVVPQVRQRNYGTIHAAMWHSWCKNIF